MGDAWGGGGYAGDVSALVPRLDDLNKVPLPLPVGGSWCLSQPWSLHTRLDSDLTRIVSSLPRPLLRWWWERHVAYVDVGVSK